MLVFFEVAQFTAIAMIGAFFNANPTRWMNLDIYSAPASVELLLLWGMFGELLFAAAVSSGISERFLPPSSTAPSPSITRKAS